LQTHEQPAAPLFSAVDCSKTAASRTSDTRQVGMAVLGTGSHRHAFDIGG